LPRPTLPHAVAGSRGLLVRCFSSPTSGSLARSSRQPCGSYLHYLWGWIQIIDQGRFDLRVVVLPRGLYKQGPWPQEKPWNSFKIY
jgi:hypothetical protein